MNKQLNKEEKMSNIIVIFKFKINNIQKKKTNHDAMLPKLKINYKSLISELVSFHFKIENDYLNVTRNFFKITLSDFQNI